MVNVASQRKEETMLSCQFQARMLLLIQMVLVLILENLNSYLMFEMTTNFQPASPSMSRQNADDFQRQIASSNVTSPSTATLPPKVLQVSCFLRRMNGQDAAGTHKTPRFQLSNTNVQAPWTSETR
ncbi:unnamed protein product [Orchesella dallaii]|uniref:Uncharacterized protein n=1 Tax=Orchesella dallaii TaxID=48710 RepID=A0ABP1R3Z6_9HEXA